MDLPGADEESDLEPGFTRRPTAWKDDPAHVGSDSVREATVVRKCAHQVAKQLVVAELELQSHLALIVVDSARLLPARTSELGPTSG
jgi:hypothetical protein